MESADWLEGGFDSRDRGVLAWSGVAGTAPQGRRGTGVVLADDDVLLREGLASLLDRSGFEVLGQAGNGTELLALVRSARPELAIIDIRMPPAHATEGLQAARVIREELPGTAIIVLSAHVEVDEAMELLTGGQGLGYLLKSRVTDVAEFIETVERITAGASVVSVPGPGTGPGPAAAGPARRAVAAGTRGAGPDGRGRLQRGDRPPDLRHRGHRRKARPQHLDQA